MRCPSLLSDGKGALYIGSEAGAVHLPEKGNWSIF